MNRLIQLIVFVAIVLATSTCNKKQESDLRGFKVAFMADIHLQDVYGEFRDSDYKGIINPKNGKYTLIRTMQAQLHSTRLFNENYFAFLAALDNVVNKGVKYVVLPGDFSDDGQPINVFGLKRILDEYSQKHGITFLATTGNHDPVRPFTQEAGKTDFLGENGMPQPIMSEESLYSSVKDKEHPAVITKDICKLGYSEIISILGDYGFFPKESDFYWETPFTNYSPEDYQYQLAKEESSIEKRNYLIPPYNTKVPDVSYLVEPIKGIWFLALDANVYIPKKSVTSSPDKPNNYSSASIGYNNVLTHKKHLIDWVKKVTKEAKRLEKKLIVFSHYPMVEFNDDASENIKAMLGNNKMQLHRIPKEDVAQAFADAGIRLHFGGHLHINDTGIRKSKSGNSLINVQIPSLAAYIPAYKLLTIAGNGEMEIETVIIDSVPGFNELFDLYKTEHDYLKSIGSNKIWDIDILSAKNYKEYTLWHLKELVKKRFLTKEWPDSLKEILLNHSGKDLLTIANLDSGIEYKNFVVKNIVYTEKLKTAWSSAKSIASKKAQDRGFDFKQFQEWSGFDLIFDLYKLRSADKLALNDIGAKRIEQYKLLFTSLQEDGKFKGGQDPLKKSLIEFANIFQKFLNGEPANHFIVNMESGNIKAIEKN